MYYSTVYVGMNTHKETFSLCCYTNEKEQAEYEKAIEFYRSSYEQLERPRSYDALAGIARTYEIMCRHDDAVGAWERVKKTSRTTGASTKGRRSKRSTRKSSGSAA